MLETQDGAFIYYEDHGSGKPIVLIHGFTCSSKFFRNNVSELSKDFRVITMDLRGHGNSSKVLCGHCIPQYARDVRALLEHLELYDVTLLGWSMGGSVVLDYWRQFLGNSRLSKLILNDNSLFPFSLEDWNAHRYKNYNYDAANAEIIELYNNPVAHTRNSARSWFKNGVASDADLEWMSKESLKIPPWIAAAIFSDFINRDSSQILPSVTVPTLVLAPGDSEKKIQACEYYVSKLSQGYIDYLDDGHTAFYTQPEKFNKLIIDFLGR